MSTNVNAAANNLKEGFWMNNMENIHVALHLAILGNREQYQLTAKNYADDDVKNVMLPKNQIMQWATNLNSNGYTIWVSLNNKESDSIEGVTELCDFWLDIDARPKGIDDRVATKAELEEALAKANKIKGYVENQYAAIGFLANSGNGFHIHFPLNSYPLLGAKFRHEVNEKVSQFAKEVSRNAGVEIDRTYDINRKTALIGLHNRKLPQNPLVTSWDKELFKEGLEHALKLVEKARAQNKTLLEAILNTELTATATMPIARTLHLHPELDALLASDEKVNDLYIGHWEKYNFKSRSEAEMSLVSSLVYYGFSDYEIINIMQNSKIGKWAEKNSSYHKLTIEKARKFQMENQGRENGIYQSFEYFNRDGFQPVLFANDLLIQYHFNV